MVFPPAGFALRQSPSTALLLNYSRSMEVII